MSTPISESIALRLALAAKALPSWSLTDFVALLVSHFDDGLTEKKLRSVSPKEFRSWFKGLADEPDRVQLAQVLAILTAEEVTPMEAPELLELPPIAGPKIRVAITSNHQQQIDGHFGSCLRVLVYEVNATCHQLVAIRPVTCHKNGDARTEFMLGLLKDCQMLATLSIGGPAAARVVRADVHPLKHAQPSSATDLLARISVALANKPAPWLQRVLDSQTQVAA